MQVILLEKIAKLGGLGDLANVKLVMQEIIFSLKVKHNQQLKPILKHLRKLRKI